MQQVLFLSISSSSWCIKVEHHAGWLQQMTRQSCLEGGYT